MKTKELESKVNQIGFKLSFSENWITIYRPNESYCFGRSNAGRVSRDEVCVFEIERWSDMSDSEKLLIIDIMREYSKTPLQDRKEEKKYYIEFPRGFNASGNTSVYLNKRLYDETSYLLSCKDDVDGYQTKFTDAEIAELPESYKLAIDSKFAKKVEVEYMNDETVKCVSCGCDTKYYHEEENGNYCPSCFAELVGIPVSEVWSCIDVEVE